jgi:lyso-ornithine lipid O-acyltransferase
MKRGGVECLIGFGEVVDPRGKDRKQLAAETESRVRARLLALKR